MEANSGYQEQSPLLNLPKELRLSIYELVLRVDRFRRVGNHDINDPGLSTWPLQPSISRTCKLLRLETLPMHYSVVYFKINIQRPSGENMVLTWLDRMTKQSAFSNISLMSVLAGLGYPEPPKEYIVDISRPSAVSATRPCAAAYLYCNRSNPRHWSRLAWGPLKKRLGMLPGRDSPGFSAVSTVRDVIATVGELSGYGLSDGVGLLENVSNSADTTLSRSTAKTGPTTLFTLPKELRLAIYEYVFAETTVHLGQRAARGSDSANLGVWPCITQTCSLIRNESLPTYFATAKFVLNIQRSQCEEIVLEWIKLCSERYHSDFQNIRHVAVTAGTGIRLPPIQYEFLVPQSKLLSSTTSVPAYPYTLPPCQWSPPPWRELKDRLQGMPRKGDDGFDPGQNLRGIIDVLARYSD